MSIELCLIVKNSGPKIVKALESWIPIIDFWTILDTGSTDQQSAYKGTPYLIKETLKNVKGQLFEEPFVNFQFDCFGDKDAQAKIVDLCPLDFAKARNRAFELCSKQYDYILVIDDTYIIKNPILLKKKLRKALAKNYNALLIDINSYRPDEKDGRNLVKDNTIPSLRIVRSSKVVSGHYKWINPIHEIIDVGGDSVINLTLDNDTYIYDEVDNYHMERSAARHKKDLVVLDICYQLSTDVKLKARYAYYGAQTAICLQKHDIVEMWLNRRMEIKSVNNVDLYHILVQYARFKNDKRYSDNAIELFPTNVEAYFESARISFFTGNYTVAYILLKHCYDVHNSSSSVMFHTTYFEFLKMLLELSLRFGYYQKVPEIAQKALACSQTDGELKKILSVCESLGIKIEKGKEENKDEIKSEYQEPEQKYQEVIITTRDKKRLVFITGAVSTGPWDGESTTVRGSETSLLKLVPLLAQTYEVIVFCETPQKEPKVIEGVVWYHLNSFIPYIKNNDVDYMVCFRSPQYLKLMTTYVKNIRNQYFWTQDTTIDGNALCPSRLAFRKFVFLTDYHMQLFANQFHLPPQLCTIISNGIDVNWIKAKEFKIDQKVKNRFIYSSDANRGLYELLCVFPMIREKLADATLHIYCDLYKNDIQCFSGDYRQQCEKKLAMVHKMVKKYSKFVTVHGRVSKEKLYNGFCQAEYWFYPNTFIETFCITALEAQYFKCKVLCPKLGALNEVVQSGVVYDESKEAKDVLCYLFDSNVDWKLEKGHEWAKSHDYNGICQKWIDLFQEHQ